MRLRSVKRGKCGCRPGAVLGAGGLGPTCCAQAPGRPSATEGVRSLGCLAGTAKGHPLAQAGSHADMGRGRDWGVFPVDQTWDVGPRDQSPSWGIEPPFHAGHQASERRSTGGVGETSPTADRARPAPPHPADGFPWLPAWTLAGP